MKKLMLITKHPHNNQAFVRYKVPSMKAMVNMKPIKRCLISILGLNCDILVRAFVASIILNKADILVSWNFKHIVNIYRSRGNNTLILRMNYLPLEIRSPKEIFEYED